MRKIEHQKGGWFAGAEREAKADNMDKRMSALKVKSATKDSKGKAAKETAKTAATAGTAAGTATTGVGGVLIGAAAGEAVGIAMDKKDVKNSTRNRMIQLFVAKLRQEENQDSIGRALKDIALMRFSMKFLKGFYNSTDQEAAFDEKRCSGECLNKLAELGMDTRGKFSYS